MRKLILSLATTTALLASAASPLAQVDGSGGSTQGTGDSGGEKPFGGNVFREDEMRQQLAPEGASQYQIGLNLLQGQKYREAIPHLAAAAANKPSDAGTLFYLGYAHQMYGRDLADKARDDEFDLAMQKYRRALVLDPDVKAAHQYLGLLYLLKHDPDSAQAQANALGRLCPSGCDERDDLNKAIAKYKATPNAPPPG